MNINPHKREGQAFGSLVHPVAKAVTKSARKHEGYKFHRGHPGREALAQIEERDKSWRYGKITQISPVTGKAKNQLHGAASKLAHDQAQKIKINKVAERQPHAHDLPTNVREKIKTFGSFKKGGKVKQTGPYRLHKGEVVIPANKAKKCKC